MLIEKYEFTYEDYLNYCDSLYCHTSKETLCVQEESIPYITDEYKKKTGDITKHKINVDELENYSENYITKDFKYKQADIVYKIKGEEIYFLIEHQTKVDYSMPYRILNYCVEIIRSAVKEQVVNSRGY